MPAAFTIRVLAWPEALPLARPVREQVFVEEQKVPRELELDEWDESCEHAVACDSRGEAVGTARLLPDGRIGRMAVLGEWRRRGVGTALLKALLAVAALVELDPAVLTETQGSRTPRPVVADREDADGREPFLEFQAYSGARKLPAGGALGIVQESKR